MSECVLGNGANAEEKRVALQMADSFIEKMNYPRMKTQVGRTCLWLRQLVFMLKSLTHHFCALCLFVCVQVEILPQGKETIIFKQFFKNWN